MNNYNKNYNELAELIEQYHVGAEEVLEIFIYWYGKESITNDFIDHVKEELGL